MRGRARLSESSVGLPPPPKLMNNSLVVETSTRDSRRTAITRDDRVAFSCLRFIRSESGKVREYELDRFFADEGLEPPRPVRLWINSLLGFQCVVSDREASSDEGDGLDVVYTDPANRLVMDLLLSEAFPEEPDTRFNMATFATNVKVEPGRIESDTASAMRLIFCYFQFQTLGNPNLAHAAALLKQHAATSTRTSLPIRTLEEIANGVANGCIDWSMDLRGVYINNFSYPKLVELVGREVIIHNLCVEQTFFAGELEMRGAKFHGDVDFAGAVFESANIDFSNAEFDLAGYGSVTFRNSRIFDTEEGHRMSFDRSTFTNPGPHSELSFEDAVLDGNQLSFSKVDLRGVNLYFFQTIAPECTARFVECRIDRQVDFDDSVLRRLLMLGMDNLGSLRLTFRQGRPIERLVIENCVVRDRLDINSVVYLSLKGSTVDGHIRTPWKKDGELNYGIIDAISKNGDTPEEKSQQFLALKQNFATLGQYDHEDKAFSQFMTQRQTGAATHLVLTVLRRIGDYGASPGKLLLTILSVWLIFASIYASWAWQDTGEFSFSGPLSVHTALAAGLLSASRLMNLGADVTPTAWLSNAVCVTEGVVGWFLLAMFSVAIVRKTVR